MTCLLSSVGIHIAQMLSVKGCRLSVASKAWPCSHARALAAQSTVRHTNRWQVQQDALRDAPRTAALQGAAKCGLHAW